MEPASPDLRAGILLHGIFPYYLLCYADVPVGPLTTLPSAGMSSPALWGLAIAGTVTAILQNLSGFPLLLKISKDPLGSHPYSPIPIYTMTITCIQIGLYGVFTQGWPDCLQLALCNALGALFWLINLCAFVYYSKTGRERLVLVGIYTLTLAWALGLPLGLYLSPTTAGLALGTKQVILGVFMQAANFSGFLSPVAALLAAWKSKDSKRVPGLLSWVNVANSTLWVAYGVVLGDGWIWIPNVVGLVLSGAQVCVLVAMQLQPGDGASAKGGLVDESVGVEKGGEAGEVASDGGVALRVNVTPVQ